MDITERLKQYLQQVQAEGKLNFGKPYTQMDLTGQINDFIGEHLDGEKWSGAELGKNKIFRWFTGNSDEKTGIRRPNPPNEIQLTAIIEFLTNPLSDHRCVDKSILLSTDHSKFVPVVLHEYFENNLDTDISSAMLVGKKFYAHYKSDDEIYRLEFSETSNSKILGAIITVFDKDTFDIEKDNQTRKCFFDGWGTITPEGNLVCSLKLLEDYQNLHLISFEIDEDGIHNEDIQHFSVFCQSEYQDVAETEGNHSGEELKISSNILIFKTKNIFSCNVLH